MRKYLSTFFIALLIVSALTTSATPSIIQAQNIDKNVTVNKTAKNYTIICGQEILVMLTVNGTGVGGPVDVMLVIDRSGSMNGYPLDAAKAAAKAFVENLTFTGDPATSDWVGISSYSTTATLDQGLTDNSTLAKSAIDGLGDGEFTNIMAAVHIAQEELATNGRNHAMDVMIVLSDGVANRWTDFDTGFTHDTATWPTTHTLSTVKAIQEATWAKGNGTIVFTIGLNLAALGVSKAVAKDTLEQMATSPDHFFDAATPGYLEDIYAEIATEISPAATDLTVTDVVADEFVIVGGSINPTPTSVVGNTITWEFDELGSETKTFQYKIRPIRGLKGNYATNVEANLTYTNSEGDPASLTCPNPEVYLYRVCESAIQLNKTANPTMIDAGDKVVYTYNVTNPGPYPLHNVNVTDDIYGTISPAPFDLDVDETKTFTREEHPMATVTNWAEAKGLDPWNYEVSDKDDATVIVQAECPVDFYTDPNNIGNITFQGEIYFNADNDTFPYGTSGSATAKAPEGWTFDHWEATGNVELTSTTANPTTVTVLCGGTLKAVFTQIECPVTFYTDPNNIGNITFEGDIYFDGDSHSFLYGTFGAATANVPDGWMFDRWEATGNVKLSSTTANPTNVTVLCGGTLKAIFIQEGTGEFGTIGYWKHVFYVWKEGAHAGKFKKYVEELLEDYLQRINATSMVFSENYTLTLNSAYELLWSRDQSMRTRALKQSLACWLNWADGAVTPSQMVDTNYDKVPDTPFGEAMHTVEEILRDPNSSRSALEHAKDICDSINNM